jgi:hypothetical protein
MSVEYLCRVFVRDVSTLPDELLAYADEKQIWAMPPGIKNEALSKPFPRGLAGAT